MFIWNDGFRVVSKEFMPSKNLIEFIKIYNTHCINSRIYVCELLENIEEEYGFLFPKDKETSIKEVLRILKKHFQRFHQEDDNPFVSKFLEALAESIPEMATDKKVA